MKDRNDLIQFGKRVRALRLARGITLQELADKIGYNSRASINKIEKGVLDVSQTKIKALADALGVSVVELLGNDPPESGLSESVSDIFITYTYDANDLHEARADQLERLAAYRALFERLSKLPDGERSRIMKLFNDMLDTFEESKNISAGSDTETT